MVATLTGNTATGGRTLDTRLQLAGILCIGENISLSFCFQMKWTKYYFVYLRTQLPASTEFPLILHKKLAALLIRWEISSFHFRRSNKNTFPKALFLLTLLIFAVISLMNFKRYSSELTIILTWVLTLFKQRGYSLRGRGKKIIFLADKLLMEDWLRTFLDI